MSTLSEELDRKYGVAESVRALRGWHLVDASLHKPGVYRITISRRSGTGANLINGFARQAIITAARELGYLSAPNGFIFPE